MAIGTAVGSMRTLNPHQGCSAAACGVRPPSRHGVRWQIVVLWICSGSRAFTVLAVRPSTACVRTALDACFDQATRSVAFTATTLSAPCWQRCSSGAPSAFVCSTWRTTNRQRARRSSKKRHVCSGYRRPTRCRSIRRWRPEFNGAQQLLGREPQSIQPLDPTDTRPALVVSELSRRTTCDPRPGVR